jgi:hypothetical protein
MHVTKGLGRPKSESQHCVRSWNVGICYGSKVNKYGFAEVDRRVLLVVGKVLEERMQAHRGTR